MTKNHLNINDIEDQGPAWGIDSLEARPIRTELGAEAIGLTHYRVKPGRRLGFGHSHDAVEEIYLVTAGDGRFKLDDEIVAVEQGTVVYCPPAMVREWEAGDDGIEVVAFGSHAENDGNMFQEWWTS
jgi:mannose-6-phosphate isomerase-like protein (cupin superfamily)